MAVERRRRAGPFSVWRASLRATRVSCYIPLGHSPRATPFPKIWADSHLCGLRIRQPPPSLYPHQGHSSGCVPRMILVISPCLLPFPPGCPGSLLSLRPNDAASQHIRCSVVPAIPRTFELVSQRRVGHSKQCSLPQRSRQTARPYGGRMPSSSSASISPL